MSWWSEAFSFIGGIGVTWLMGVKYVGGLAERKVQQKLDQGLEDHKAKLTAIKDAAAFDYQRKIHDFSMYSTKKHEIYSGVYKKFLLARGEIVALDNLNKKVDEEMSSLIKDDYHTYIDETEMEDSLRSVMRKEVEEGRYRSIEGTIKRRLRYEKSLEAESKHNALNSYYLLHELFCSEEVEKILDRSLEIMSKLLMLYRENNLDPTYDLKVELLTLQNELKLKLKQEISVGDYTNT